jgi:hypothetical protein
MVFATRVPKAVMEAAIAEAVPSETLTEAGSEAIAPVPAVDKVVVPPTTEAVAAAERIVTAAPTD